MRKVAAIILVFITSPVLAQSIPRVDIDQACRANDIWRFYRGTTNEEVYKKCMNENQKNYDELKAGWENLSWNERNSCLGKSSTGPDTRYLFLNSCSKEFVRKQKMEESDRIEAEKRRQIPKQEFRY